MRIKFSSDNQQQSALWEYIDHLAIYNTHEHLPPNKAVYRSLKKDILQDVLCGYLQTDLRSAGMRQGDLDMVLRAENDLQDRWKVLSPYWAATRNTGYGLAAQIGCEELLGQPIETDTILQINTRYSDLLSEDFYDTILKKKSQLIISLLDKCQPLSATGAQVNVIDTGIEVEFEYFKPVYRLDHFIYPRDWVDIQQIESQFDISVNSLDDWLRACEMALQGAISKGVVAFKSALAYIRSLNYEMVTKSAAEIAFIELLNTRRNMGWEKLSIQPGLAFQNYMMHHILSLVESVSLPIQFHTGLQAGFGNYLADTNPLLLTNLFLNYSKVNFVLLHMGYPFYQEAASLTKMFTNVFLDLSWVHIISPETVVRVLAEWVHFLPENKIMAFGGDLPSVICLYGHQKLARRNVYKALTGKITESDLDLASAKRISEKWFVTNPRQVYQL